MYEGRAQRFPTATQRREVLRRDRHCAFPGCANVLFTNCHHIDEWNSGGVTDLDNLVLLCKHHHDLIHHKVWSLSGDANVELRFVGPTGQVMTTRPSRLWAQVSDPTVLAERRAQARRGAGAGAGTGAARPNGARTADRTATVQAQTVKAGTEGVRGGTRVRAGSASKAETTGDCLAVLRAQSFSSIVTLSITTCSFGVPERLPNLLIFSTTSRPVTTSPKSA